MPIWYIYEYILLYVHFSGGDIDLLATGKGIHIVSLVTMDCAVFISNLSIVTQFQMHTYSSGCAIGPMAIKCPILFLVNKASLTSIWCVIAQILSDIPSPRGGTDQAMTNNTCFDAGHKSSPVPM